MVISLRKVLVPARHRFTQGSIGSTVHGIEVAEQLAMSAMSGTMKYLIRVV